MKWIFFSFLKWNKKRRTNQRSYIARAMWKHNETHSIELNERFQFYCMRRFIKHSLIRDSTLALRAPSKRQHKNNNNNISTRIQAPNEIFVPLDFSPYGFIIRGCKEPPLSPSPSCAFFSSSSLLFFVVAVVVIVFFGFYFCTFFRTQVKIWKQILTINLDIICKAHIRCVNMTRHRSNTHQIR